MNSFFLYDSNVEQRPLWDRVEKLQPRPGSGSSSGSSNSSSQASPGDRFRPRCESPGTVLEHISRTLQNNCSNISKRLNVSMKVFQLILSHIKHIYDVFAFENNFDLYCIPLVYFENIVPFCMVLSVFLLHWT